MVQWLRLCAPNAGDRGVQSLVRELDPTCHSEDSHMMQLTQYSQINTNVKKKLTYTQM